MDLQTGDITSDNPDTGTSVSSDYRNEASPLNLIPGTAGIQRIICCCHTGMRLSVHSAA